MFSSIYTNTHHSFTINEFFNKTIHLRKLPFFLSEVEIASFLEQLKQHSKDSSNNVRMDDGYFYPFPYSTIHDQASFDQNHPYFTSGADFHKKHESFSKDLQSKLEETLQVELHPLNYQGLDFSKFNCRILYAQKNGIDIHCENAFIPQLNPAMSSWMESILDLKNALSFLLVLQAPRQGGELVLFNQEWDDIEILIQHEPYADRHDTSGGMFKKHGAKNVQHFMFPPMEGEAILFRAAQIWHGINKIEGDNNRITIGCFIAKGLDGKYYFWA